MKKTFSPFDKIYLRMRAGTCLAFLVCSFPVFAQEAAQSDQSSDTAAAEKPKSEEVVLPSAEVRAQRETAEHISQEQMTERGDTTLVDAIRWVPGIVTNTGHPGYDSGAFGVRGYGGNAHDGDHLAVFVDGVPMLNGWDGRIDYNSILTGGLESIDISKGYNSVLMGPNNIGGALNVRTAKPKKAFELAARTGFTFDGSGFSGNTDSLTVGTRQDLFYAQVGFDGNFVDHWRLSDKWEPTDDTPPEEGGNPQKNGDRVGSKSTNVGVKGMVGVTPFEELDIWTTYNFTYREKGLAPFDAASATVPGLTIWPGESRHSMTFHTEYTPRNLNLKLNAYWDKNDSTELSMAGTGAERWANYQKYLNEGMSDSVLGTHRDHDRDTFGVNLEGRYDINDWNQIAAAMQFRQQEEIIYSKSGSAALDHDDVNKTGYWKDQLWYGALEYTVNPIKPFTAIFGLGIDYWAPQDEIMYSSVKYQLPESTVAPQWAVGLFYDLSELHELHLTYAKKHRFPGFYERTQPLQDGGRTGKNKPNPNLKPVEMHNFEFGYKGYFLDRIRVTSAIFMNYELNRVTQVLFPNPDIDGYDRQYQNVGEILYYGVEFGTEMFLNDYFTVGGSFGVNRYDILHTEQDLKYLGNVANLTSNGYVTITPFTGLDTGIFQNIKIMPRIEYVPEIDIASFGASQTRVTVPSYVLAHLRLSVDIAKNYWASFSINNITDELYYTATSASGYPGRGRSFNLTLGAKF
jgi:iron complex outermembrane receptor protein